MTKSKTGKSKYVYFFGAGRAEGAEDRKDLLGGKGANLHGMTKLGLPVPPGFTVSTEVCTYFYANSKTTPKALEAQMRDAMTKIERAMKRGFGSKKSPLLV
jgi:pyruvate,orthophosphate dikinase